MALAEKNLEKTSTFYDFILTSVKSWLLKVHPPNKDKNGFDFDIPEKIKFKVLDCVDRLKP